MDLYGPALPPGYIKPVDEEVEQPAPNSHGKIIGPQCSGFMSTEKEPALSIGPELPPHLRDDEVGEILGPEPNEYGAEIDDISARKAAIEKRAEEMRNKLDNKNVPVKVNEREEWMTVPDTSRKNQLGAISRCLAPPKASATPKDGHSHLEKDKKTSQELKKYNKSRRPESLLDMHAKKLKKKDKEKKKKEERKAFDRDEVAVGRFTSDQVNSVIDKAKYLNSRFAPGNKQYL